MEKTFAYRQGGNHSLDETRNLGNELRRVRRLAHGGQGLIVQAKPGPGSLPPVPVPGNAHGVLSQIEFSTQI